jgi:ribonucleoside-triphosphate reductase
LSPEDAVSMCCRLRLDTTELRKRGGGLFGSNPLTGSIGVVTINLPRIGYISQTKSEFKARLWRIANIAKTSLEIKRKIIEKQSDKRLYPYSTFYLKGVKERTGEYWNNHFSTIGIIGMNEALMNFMGKDLSDEEGQEFAIEIMNYLREIMVDFQEETKHFYNLEATPAEGASYRLANIDKSYYEDIITAGDEVCYYTNSTQLPVEYTEDIFEMLDLQDELQTLYTGGTVQHLYLGESIDDIEVCKNLIQKIFKKYSLPYISITPTFSVCNDHGYIKGEHFECPECGNKTEVWSRVTGYLRPVENYNKGKKIEYFDRKKLVISGVRE